jgi:hypothetical protein
MGKPQANRCPVHPRSPFISIQSSRFGQPLFVIHFARRRRISALIGIPGSTNVVVPAKCGVARQPCRLFV